MVTGKLPYAIYNNPMTAMYRIASGEIPQIDADVARDVLMQDFVTKCCTVDPVQRPSVSALINHSWLQPATSSSSGMKSPYIPLRLFADPAPVTPLSAVSNAAASALDDHLKSSRSNNSNRSANKKQNSTQHGKQTTEIYQRDHASLELPVYSPQQRYGRSNEDEDEGVEEEAGLSVDLDHYHSASQDLEVEDDDEIMAHSYRSPSKKSSSGSNPNNSNNNSNNNSTTSAKSRLPVNLKRVFGADKDGGENDSVASEHTYQRHLPSTSSTKMNHNMPAQSSQQRPHNPANSSNKVNNKSNNNGSAVAMSLENTSYDDDVYYHDDFDEGEDNLGSNSHKNDCNDEDASSYRHDQDVSQLTALADDNDGDFEVLYREEDDDEVEETEIDQHNHYRHRQQQEQKLSALQQSTGNLSIASAPAVLPSASSSNPTTRLKNYNSHTSSKVSQSSATRGISLGIDLTADYNYPDGQESPSAGAQTPLAGMTRQGPETSSRGLNTNSKSNSISYSNANHNNGNDSNQASHPPTILPFSPSPRTTSNGIVSSTGKGRYAHVESLADNNDPDEEYGDNPYADDFELTQNHAYDGTQEHIQRSSSDNNHLEGKASMQVQPKSTTDHSPIISAGVTAAAKARDATSSSTHRTSAHSTNAGVKSHAPDSRKSVGPGGPTGSVAATKVSKDKVHHLQQLQSKKGLNGQGTKLTVLKPSYVPSVRPVGQQGVKAGKGNSSHLAGVKARTRSAGVYSNNATLVLPNGSSASAASSSSSQNESQQGRRMEVIPSSAASSNKAGAAGSLLGSNSKHHNSQPNLAAGIHERAVRTAPAVPSTLQLQHPSLQLHGGAINSSNNSINGTNDGSQSHNSYYAQQQQQPPLGSLSANAKLYQQQQQQQQQKRLRPLLPPPSNGSVTATNNTHNHHGGGTSSSKSSTPVINYATAATAIGKS